jgi:hypothetical protein
MIPETGPNGVKKRTILCPRPELIPDSSILSSSPVTTQDELSPRLCRDEINAWNPVSNSSYISVLRGLIKRKEKFTLAWQSLQDNLWIIFLERRTKNSQAVSPTARSIHNVPLCLLFP